MARSPNSKGRPFLKGKQHPNWIDGRSLNKKNYQKEYYNGKGHERITKRNRSRTKEQMKNEFIKSKYGITLKDYKDILFKQNGVCAICEKSEIRKSRYGGICLLSVDHDHKTEKVRGLLCQKCNTGLGYFKDEIDILKKAIKYLKNSTENKY